MTCDEDGEYSIHINARLSDEMKAHVFAHELNHIKCGHQEAVDNIEQCEKDAWIQPIDQELLNDCIFWGYCSLKNNELRIG